MSEQLSQQELAVAQGRVAQALSGQSQPEQQATSQQAVVTTPARATRGSGKTTRRRTGSPNQASPSADSTPTVNISLPKEIYDHFQKQADADERTLAKYLQRVVKQVYVAQVRAASGINDDDSDEQTQG